MKLSRRLRLRRRRRTSEIQRKARTLTQRVRRKTEDTEKAYGNHGGKPPRRRGRRERQQRVTGAADIVASWGAASSAPTAGLVLGGDCGPIERTNSTARATPTATAARSHKTGPAATNSTATAA